MSADDDSPSFFHNRRSARLHRFESDVKGGRDLLVRVTFGDQFYDVSFPVTELGGFLQPAR